MPRRLAANSPTMSYPQQLLRRAHQPRRVAGPPLPLPQRQRFLRRCSSRLRTKHRRRSCLRRHNALLHRLPVRTECLLGLVLPRRIACRCALTI
jgi:hypothetical protein